MTITLVKNKNILDAKSGIICHGCNNKGIMGAGLAKQIRDRMPVIYDLYKQECNAGRFNLGNVYIIQCGLQHWVANCCTQRDLGANAKSYAVLTCLDNVLDWCISNNQVCHIPKIGCGIGGLHWDELKPDIEHLIKIEYKNNVEAVIYE